MPQLNQVLKMTLIQKIEAKVKEQFEGEGTGHDWHHIDRVRKNSLTLGEREGADLEVVNLGALLHDIADHKFHNNDLSVGPNTSRKLILEFGGTAELAERIAVLVAEISFKGAGVETPVSTIEAAVVQDADRMDAIGAIGIARAFAYGGSKHRAMYNPELRPNLHNDFQAYATDKGGTINHFYEKLLLLKDRMQTEAGREMAAERHVFMEQYLETFYAEWDGKI